MRNLYLHILFTAIGVLLLSSCNNDKLLDGIPFDYRQKTTLPGEGRACAVAFSINDKGYVALGRNNAGSLNDCWQYDPATDSWLKKSNFPGTGRVKAIAAVVNGNAYVGLGYCREIGGFPVAAAYLSDFWMYDPITDKWTRKADFPSKYTNGCTSFVYNNEIYVSFGFNGAGGSPREFWKYNPDQNRWTILKKFVGDYRQIPVACAGTNHCYFGTGYLGKSLNDWWEYYPATDSWKQRKSLPGHGRQNTLAFAVGDRYFVATGRYWRGNSEANQYLRADVKEYDPNRNRWIDRGEIPNGKRENGIAFTIDGTVYLGLGEDDNGFVNNFWSFKP
jgi:N-acetylneuraminic acid mutarotase